MGTKNTQYTISQLSSRLNISGPTLRFWENEFAGVFKPLRTIGGQRRYTTAHVEILEKIISLKKKGMKLSEIREKLKGANQDLQAPPRGDDPIDLLAERIAQTVRKEIHQFFQNNGWER